ncbi:MAG: class I SAM-dependent methyltransferase [Ferruginibacter sp.]
MAKLPLRILTERTDFRQNKKRHKYEKYFIELTGMSQATQDHWDSIYKTKDTNQVSWTQEFPKISLDFIHSFGLAKTAKIIDIGGGDSKLVDHLLDEGFENITVLDISALALARAKKRLGNNAHKINWVVSDITKFKPGTMFDVWHDRATFHFLTTREQFEKYMDIARNAVAGYLTIGTFSDTGPEKCSGLPIKKYSEETLTAILQNGFDKLRCITEDHQTPFNTTQNFLFCSFKRHLKYNTTTSLYNIP